MRLLDQKPQLELLEEKPGLCNTLPHACICCVTCVVLKWYNMTVHKGSINKERRDYSYLTSTSFLQMSSALSSSSTPHVSTLFTKSDPRPCSQRFKRVSMLFDEELQLATWIRLESRWLFVFQRRTKERVGRMKTRLQSRKGGERTSAGHSK